MTTFDVLEVLCVVIGIAVATGGGLLALVADPERPAQCLPVFVAAVAVFCGGLALICWYEPIVAYVVPAPGTSAPAETPEGDEPAEAAAVTRRGAPGGPRLASRAAAARSSSGGAATGTARAHG